ncbi:MAG: flagellar biosynthesis anti-sigma factor FlgM [Planctomycetes bacterium]|nr:flagellar biosynthesis anti-sigma factor FlgM [Planctomycetota bacterium]
MDVNGLNNIQGAGKVNFDKVAKIDLSRAQAPDARKSGVDSVQISDVAKYLNAVAKMPDLRNDKVKELKAQIESGQYESMDRLKSAVSKFLEEHKNG